MHDDKAIETILSRLMPPALSESGQRGIETMLDELAGSGSANEAPAARPRPLLWPLIGGIAAAMVALAVISHSFHPAAPSAVSRPVAAHPPAFELVGESDRVEAVRDDGWRENPEGSALRAMRLRVIEENSLLDHETGIVMRITEPRDELLLMPVSAF
jgi:hypothetical protein